jgi:hypothetical protein
MDRYPRVYTFSESYGPPRIDLRRAKILDDYGDDQWSTLEVCHRYPKDVSRKELDHYAWVYPFMEFRDLLFYLYPVALEYERNPTCDFVHSFLYSLDSGFEEGVAELSDEDREALKAGLIWIWSDWGSDYAPWWQCKQLSEFIHVEPD